MQNNWYAPSVGFVCDHGMKDAGLLIYSVQFTFCELILKEDNHLEVGRRAGLCVSPLVVLIRGKHS